jgi:CubicO group peptidase (beta-lactamase class C family)
MNQLMRCAPEAQGISSTALLQFVEALDRDIAEVHSFQLLRRGVVVAEGWWAPYAPERPHMLFSLSKSFTSSAIGLAVSEGLLSLDDRVVDLFPEDAPASPSANLARMRVRDLLCMGCGHAVDSTDALHARQDGCWKKAFLEQPVEYEPGTHFVYNSGATYMLSAIVQKVSGQTLLDYLTPRLFNPLGIEKPTWESSPEGINTGGWGLSIKTEDIARFGQMYLQKGVWEVKQILPAAWVEEATSKHIENAGLSSDPDYLDWQQGYCYQFWRCRHGAYRGDGAFGQYCIVMPEQEAVLAITSGTSDLQGVLDRVWKHVLPAFGPDALPENPTAQAELQNKLGSLALCPPKGSAFPEAQTQWGGVYDIQKNELGMKAVRFDFGAEITHLHFSTQGGEGDLALGNSGWVEGPGILAGQFPKKAAAAGAWDESHSVFTAVVRFFETPFFETFRFRFEGERVVFESGVNVSFGPTEYPTLEGVRRKV